MGNREIARARNKKQRRPISLEEKHENSIAAMRKWEMLAATKVKMSDSENKSEQEHIQNFFHKTCKSCKTTAKRSTKKCAARANFLFYFC